MTSLKLRAQNASATCTAIKPGDLLLITQASDSLSGSGAVATSGPLEYVVAQNAVGPTGGVLNLQGVGPGGGLLNSYSSGQGQGAFEIIDLDAQSAANPSTEPGVPGAATSVLTQQLDYSPGQTAFIEAAGFRAGETVRFQVSNLTNGHVYGAWTVAAGAWANRHGVGRASGCGSVPTCADGDGRGLGLDGAVHVQGRGQ